MPVVIAHISILFHVCVSLSTGELEVLVVFSLIELFSSTLFRHYLVLCSMVGKKISVSAEEGCCWRRLDFSACGVTS